MPASVTSISSATAAPRNDSVRVDPADRVGAGSASHAESNVSSASATSVSTFRQANAANAAVRNSSGTAPISHSAAPSSAVRAASSAGGNGSIAFTSVRPGRGRSEERGERRAVP